MTFSYNIRTLSLLHHVTCVLFLALVSDYCVAFLLQFCPHRFIFDLGYNYNVIHIGLYLYQSVFFVCVTNYSYRKMICLHIWNRTNPLVNERCYSNNLTS